MSIADNPDYIDIEDASHAGILMAAFALTKPMTSHADELTHRDAISLVNMSTRNGYPLSVDYVGNRAIKISIFALGDRFYMLKKWADHRDGQMVELLRAVGLHKQAMEVIS